MARRNLTLRLKLTAWYLLVFACIQLTLLLGVVLFQRDTIRRSNDDRLLLAAQGVSTKLVEGGIPTSRDALRALAPRDNANALIVVRDRTRRVILSSIESDQAPPFAERAQPATGIVGTDFGNIASTEAAKLTGVSETLRLVTLPFREPGGNVLYLQMAVPATSLARALGDYADLLWIGFPVGLLAASVAAWLIAGRAVQPLLAISRAAREVSPTNPGVRIELGSPDQEIARLNEDLNRALERMEAGFRAQEQFIANVSHELKTPITVMMTELQVLKQRSAPSPEYEGFVASAEEELRRLNGLVDSFLKLARFQSGLEGFQLCDVPVQDIVLEAIQHCSRLAKLHEVRLLPIVAEREGGEGEAEVSGDPQLLRTMIDNLIRNAIHFSPTHEVVEVICRCTREEAQFIVRDHGPGLPEAYLEHIFERFTQVPDGARRERGSGLGLAIVREVTELHGGRVSASNNEDRGCSFTVTLPLSRSSRGVSAR